MAKRKEQKKYKMWPSRMYPSEVTLFNEARNELNEKRSQQRLHEINNTLLITHFMRFFTTNPERALRAIKYDEID